MGINNGVTAPFDLDGNPRIGGDSVDIGAYEKIVTAVKEMVIGEVSLSPNPATDFLNIDFPEAIGRQLEVQLFDTQGRLIRH